MSLAMSSFGLHFGGTPGVCGCLFADLFPRLAAARRLAVLWFRGPDMRVAASSSIAELQRCVTELQERLASVRAPILSVPHSRDRATAGAGTAQGWRTPKTPR